MKTDYLKPIGGKSTVDQIIDSIVGAITTKQWKRGTKIPTEVELCEIFGVSRNSVREAIKVLISLGLLEIRRSDGTYVVETFSDKMLNPLIYSLVLEDDDSLALLEFRQIFDVGSTQLAIRKATEEDKEAIRQNCNCFLEMEKRGERDVEVLLQQDLAFHEVLSSACHNNLVERMNKIIAQVSYASRYKTIQRMVEQNDVAFLVGNHIRIADMIFQKDGSRLVENIRYSYKYWEDILAEKEQKI